MQFDQLRRREFITLLGGATATWPFAASAQQPAKVPTVGFLGAESASTNQHFFDAFRQGMREHGYIDGKNVTFVERWAEGRSERFPELVGELLSLTSHPAPVVAAINGHAIAGWEVSGGERTCSPRGEARDRHDPNCLHCE
jgi:hypothetical protein